MMKYSFDDLLNQNEWRSSLFYFLKDNFDNIIKNIKKISGNNIYPKKEDLFKPFNNTDLKDVKMLILNNSPYLEEDLIELNDGLAMSLSEDIQESEIYKLNSYFGNSTSNLEAWSKKGVLLLNSTLTVSLNISSHHLYWKEFLIHVLKVLNKNKPIVVILMGRIVRKYQYNFDSTKHKVIILDHTSRSEIDIKLFEAIKIGNEWIEKIYGSSKMIQF